MLEKNKATDANEGWPARAGARSLLSAPFLGSVIAPKSQGFGIIVVVAVEASIDAFATILSKNSLLSHYCCILFCKLKNVG